MASISLKTVLCVYCTVVTFTGVTSAFSGVLGAKFTGWCVLGIVITLAQRDLIFFVHNLFVLDINSKSRSHTLERRAGSLQGITLPALPNVLRARQKVLTGQSFFKHVFKASVCLKALIYRNWDLNRAKRGSC